VTTSITAPITVAARDGAGYVSAKFSVTTIPPTKRILGSAASGGDDDGSETGGLHCMASGFGVQALMFLGLLAFAVASSRRRKEA